MCILHLPGKDASGGDCFGCLDFLSAEEEAARNTFEVDDSIPCLGSLLDTVSMRCGFIVPRT